ncbi:MAG: hypothetical protein M1833_006646 [Piccolia ochrophora]|nr:MAG: hypothetical protein M1833_006646 [Piccolia ochrophora]
MTITTTAASRPFELVNSIVSHRSRTHTVSFFARSMPTVDPESLSALDRANYLANQKQADYAERLFWLSFAALFIPLLTTWLGIFVGVWWERRIWTRSQDEWMDEVRSVWASEADFRDVMRENLIRENRYRNCKREELLGTLAFRERMLQYLYLVTVTQLPPGARARWWRDPKEPRHRRRSA